MVKAALIASGNDNYYYHKLFPDIFRAEDEDTTDIFDEDAGWDYRGVTYEPPAEDEWERIKQEMQANQVVSVPLDFTGFGGDDQEIPDIFGIGNFDRMEVPDSPVVNVEGLPDPPSGDEVDNGREWI